jgi:hypothetical protein
MSNGDHANGWGLYLDSIREHSHQLLAWGYADVRAELHSDLDEPAITGLLCQAMQRRIYHPETPDRYLNYAVHDQPPISPEGELGNDRLRLDVSVRRTGIRQEVVYVFEAKRLRTGSFTIGKYVGEGGMGDFIECRYAVGYPEGAMIGLWQDRDLAYWRNQLGNAYDSDKRSSTPKLCIATDLADSKVISDIPNEWESAHHRTDGSSIILKHVFLDCRSLPI